MQQSEGSSPIAATIDLQYPTIVVYGTPSSWLFQSQLVTMASNPDDSSFDDTSSSLGDSAYEFVDDKSAVASDDEEQDNLTQSASSTEDREIKSSVNNRHHGPDEERSQPSRSHSSSLSFDQDDALTTGSQSSSDETGPIEEKNMVDTNKTISNGMEQDKQQMIQLNEPRNIDPDAVKEVEGSYTLKVFQGLEFSEMLRHFRIERPSTQGIATVRQTMASQRLGLNGPYKVLYVGDVSAKESIIRKLGSALASSLGSEVFQRSRFNIVPISSFGEATSPEVVLIDSTGLEINVEECISASFTKMEGGNDTITINLSNQQVLESSWSGTAHVVTDHWNTPDLVIFYQSEDDDISAKQTRHFAQKFMIRHKIPYIVISQHFSWTKPADFIMLNQKTPHICLETQCSNFAEFQVIKRLPIDQMTFLELDAVQLNRNLAYLAAMRQNSEASLTQSRLASSCEPQRAPKSNPKGPKWLTGLSYFDETYILEKFRLVEKLLTSGLFLIFGLLFYHFVINGFFMFDSPPTPSSQKALANTDTVPGVLLTRSMTTIPTSSNSVSPPTVNPTSSFIYQHYVSKAKPVLDTNTDIASFLLDRDALLPNKSDKFYVKIIGDYHIVIKTPQWLTRYKRTPKIKCNVVRGRQPLKYQLSMIFDGVYALEIPREDAYGTLNVSISTVSKPGINESFELCFGNSWFKSLGWRRTTQTLTNLLRSNMSFISKGVVNTYNYTTTEIQSFVGAPWGKPQKARNEANKLRGVPMNKTKKPADIVLGWGLGNFSQQLSSKGLAASNYVMVYAENICKDLFAYSGNTSFLISRQARQLSQTASDNIELALRHLVESRKKHLRDTQKKTLKIWWKIRGLPKRHVLPNEKLRTGSSRPKRKFSR